MCREERVLVTVLCRESTGLVGYGADAVASLALELSESSSSSLSSSRRCRPVIGAGRAECPDGCRCGGAGPVAGAFFRA